MKKFLLFLCLGVMTTSWIMAQSTPYEGTPASIPGIVFADKFDEGGNGIAYLDNDTRDGDQTYRATETVDMEASPAGGYNIGWTAVGEWVKYTVDIKTAGTYEVRALVASGNTAGPYKFVLSFASGAVVDTFMVSPTGGWQNWVVLKETVDLVDGIDTLTLFEVTDGFNFHSFEFLMEGGDAGLDSVKLGDRLVAGFIPWKTDYIVRCPGPVVPAATAFPIDPEAAVTVVDATEWVDTSAAEWGEPARITVVSADETVTREFIFYLVEMFSDATLKMIKVAGVELEGFAPNIFSYDVELPTGTTKVPTVAGTVNNVYAKMKKTNATELPGTTTIEVTAEDGTTETYSVNFTVAPSAIEQNDAEGFAIYPNPASGQVNIDLGIYAGKAVVLTVSTIQGQVIQQLDLTGLDKYVLSLDNLSDAVYFISLTSQEGKRIQKLFVK